MKVSSLFGLPWHRVPSAVFLLVGKKVCLSFSFCTLPGHCLRQGPDHVRNVGSCIFNSLLRRFNEPNSRADTRIFWKIIVDVRIVSTRLARSCMYACFCAQFWLSQFTYGFKTVWIFMHRKFFSAVFCSPFFGGGYYCVISELSIPDCWISQGQRSSYSSIKNEINVFQKSELENSLFLLGKQPQWMSC